MLDRTRLIKLLAMTTSDNDGEALNAMRMANKMLAHDQVTWEDVLVQRVLSISIQRNAPVDASFEQGTPWVAPHLKDKVTIDLMFRAIFAQPRGDESIWQFLDSVHNWWQSTGSLTQGQYNAVRKCYQKCVNVRAASRQG